MKFIDLLIKSLREGLFPPVCLKCRQTYRISIERHEEALARYAQPQINTDPYAFFRSLITAYLCPPCQAGFLAVESPFCPRCGVMFKSRQGTNHVCGRCLQDEPSFSKARAFGVYNETLKDLIYCFKYHGKVQLARPFAFFLFFLFVRDWEPRAIDIIAPIPLHWRRMYQRGYNQAYLIIRKWRRMARAFEVHPDRLQIEPEVLVRRRHTASQVGMSIQERRKNIKNAFEVKGPEKIKGKRILLIDDVLTTGATADACARVLIKGGARRVDILTLARAVKRR